MTAKSSHRQLKAVIGNYKNKRKALDLKLEAEPGQNQQDIERSPKRKPRFWTEDEDSFLRAAVVKYKGKSWSDIARMVPGRNTKECVQRWKKVLAPTLRKGKWSKSEDDLLLKLIKEQLAKTDKLQWSTLADKMGTRSCKQCRERWTNHLNPALVKSKWTPEEDEKLQNLGNLFPNQWAKLARSIPGRTENMVKCRWNTLKRREQKQKTKSKHTVGRMEKEEESSDRDFSSCLSHADCCIDEPGDEEASTDKTSGILHDKSHGLETSSSGMTMPNWFTFPDEHYDTEKYHNPLEQRRSSLSLIMRNANHETENEFSHDFFDTELEISIPRFLNLHFPAMQEGPHGVELFT